jgi:glycosyltransferase involved in cell wall biosynthesis
MPFQVIAGSPYWAMNGVNIFSANLVRGLIALGVPAHIVLTEQHSRLVDIQEPMMPLPKGVPVEELPSHGQENWGAHWGAMIRYLEQRAPCVYIPNHDWRHSVVCSRLSPKVRVVGVVHSDDPLHYDHVARLGRYWDAIVATTDAIATQVISHNPGLAKRVTTIPIGVPVPERLPLREAAPGAPLRLVYQGALIQHQKRVLDLPKIVEEALHRDTPVELTVIGDGQDREALRAASSHLMERGAVKFLGLLPHARLMELLGQFDVSLLTSEFEGMPNALGEAMARGCVPIVTDIRSGMRELVRDGENGFVVPVGGIGAFAAKLALLHRDSQLRSRMSGKARQAVIAGGFDVRTMVARYSALFSTLFGELFTRSRFWRPTGILRLPPSQVNRVKLFETPEARRFEGVGVLPSSNSYDYEAYLRELGGAGGRRLPPWRRDLTHPYPNVVVSATSGRLSGVDIFSAHLVRGLRELGQGAHVLMTCPDDSTPDAMTFPADIPVETLPVSRNMPWRKRWKALSDHLEGSAPGIYIPNYDWRNSCISPTLSRKVGIVGIVHSDDPIHYEHVARLGRYWNAVVAVSQTIADRVIQLDPTLAPRLVTIPYGVKVPEALPECIPTAGGALRIVYAGRLVQEQKRVLDLPLIFNALMERGVPAELTIVGSGADEAALKDACGRWAGAGRVRFLGTLPNQQVLQVFEQSDVLLLTSEFEGLPVSLLEAMAHGCVPVVTDIPSGIPELVRSGETGYRVRVGDIAGFADCLANLQSSPAKRRELSAASYTAIRAGGFSVENMVAAYLNLFERVLVEAEVGEFQRPRGHILPPPNSPWLTWGRRSELGTRLAAARNWLGQRGGRLALRYASGRRMASRSRTESIRQ